MDNLDYLDYDGYCPPPPPLETVRWGRVCDSANALYSTLVPFSVNSAFDFTKMTKVYDGTAKKGFANNAQRMIVEDFNGRRYR